MCMPDLRVLTPQTTVNRQAYMLITSYKPDIVNISRT